MEIVNDLITTGEQNLLILDEVIAAAAYNLIKRANVESIIDLFRENQRFELVMTGHKIWKEIEDKVDLITEMKKVKHYFDAGIPARQGIEF